RQTDDERTSLFSRERHLCVTGPGPVHTALVQPSYSQPDAEAIAHQHLHPCAAAVGKHVGVVRLRGAEDLDHTGEQPIHPAAHVHGFHSQPDLGRNTSAQRSSLGLCAAVFGLNISSLVSRSRTRMWSGLIARFATSGCPNTTGTPLITFSRRQLYGCGPTITNARIWHWADSPQNSGWPWLHSVATSEHR